MCGRIAFFKSKKKVINELQIDKWDEYQYSSDYNIVPSNKLYVLTSKKSLRVVNSMTWGIIPKRLKKKRLINARIETLQQKSSFRNLLKTNRCLIVCDGYYEWKREDKNKVPYYFSKEDDEIMFFAAIHQNNQFCIITKEATEKVSSIHHREPLIVNQSQINNYLNIKKDAMEILNSIKPPNLKFYEISKDVNNPVNNDPAIIKPVN